MTENDDRIRLVKWGKGQMTKAILLFSGGIDSSVALFWALSKGWEVVPLTINYKDRPEAERRAMRSILKKAGVNSLIEIPLEFMKDVEELKKIEAVPSNLTDAPESYIPARNMVFYAIAAYFAETLEASAIIGGHNQTDPKIFPDSGTKFFRRLGIVFEQGLMSYTKNPVKIVLPLSRYTKAQIVRLGRRLAAPLEITWSCEFDGKEECGNCPSCKDKERAFATVGAGTTSP